MFSDSFKRYAQWNARDSETMFIEQSRKLADELYKQTVLIAPTVSQIASDVKAQGWKIPAKFADGQTGRGFASQWLGNVAAKREKRKGRKEKGQSAGDDSAMRGKATLAQMQAYVIGLRSRARRYLASGWLGSVVELGGTPDTSSGPVNTARGGTMIRRGTGTLEITLWNRTPGIESMDDQHQMVAKAIAVRSADMWVYIRRKMDEAASRFMRAA